MAVGLTINDVDKTTEIRASSISVRFKASERPTATFTSEAKYSTGQKVGIFDGGTRRFGGTIDEVRELAPIENATYNLGHAENLEYEYACTGWEHILDRRYTDGEVYGGWFFADDATDVCTQYGHGLSNGQRIQLATTGTLPAGLSVATTYYVRDKTDDTFKIAASAGGAAINITSTGSGAHRLLWRSTDIILALVSAHTSGDSMTTTNVTAGAFVEKQSFDVAPLSDAFTKIAQLADFVWWVDPDLDLHFEAAGAASAPFTLASNSTQAFDLSVVRESREDYRNRQHIRISSAPQQSQIFAGDGATQTFWLDNRPSSIVQVRNNTTGTDFTVGLYGEDTGFEFYWSPGERLIVQDATGTPIPGGEDLIVIYQGVGDNVVTFDDTGEQSDRATVEGNSGVYERIDDGGTLSADAAYTFGSVLAANYKIFRELTFRSTNTGFRPHQGMLVNLGAHFISGPLNEFIIDSTTLTVEMGRMYALVTANDGYNRRSAGDLFRSFQTPQSGTASNVVASGGASGASSGVTLDGVQVTY